MGAVAVGRVLGLAATAEGKRLTCDSIDFVGRGLPAHGLIIEPWLENESANCGRWKAGGVGLLIYLIPIEKDAGGGVERELVATLQSAPAILVSFGIQGHLGVWGMGDVVQKNEMSLFIKFLW